MNLYVFSPSPGVMGEGLGGKAANLAVLESLNFPVPPWYAITTAAFDSALAAAGLRDPGLSADEIRSRILAVPFPSGLEEEIAAAHAARIGPDGESAYVAVRSSAAGEDAAGESFAGLHDSFLFIRGREQLLIAIRKVWASAWNERALAYRRAKGIPLD